jgi:pimeloyl-ACP methyl ester carboxylesterase
MISRRSTFLAATLPLASRAQAQKPRWLTLPPTPSLPKTEHSGFAAVNWGLQIPAVAQHYRTIVMESRGHGRSTRDDRPYGYDLMADDVVALLDFLKIERAAIVGWSDGGILGLDLAIRHPGRVTKVFAFAANTDPSGVIDGTEKNPTFAAYIERAGHEYAKLSATPNGYTAFVDAISKMWATQPNWTTQQLGAIKTPVLVVDGDHDEAIKRSHTEQIAAQVPGAGLLILPDTSHFAFLQDPDQFTWHILHFLAQKP